MQSNYSGSLLRNSYGYQSSEQQALRSSTSRGFPMPQPHHPHHPHDNVTTTIKSMKSKIEGFQGLMKRKQTQEAQPNPTNLPKTEAKESCPKKIYSANEGQQLFTDGMLRGSCQNVLKKFDNSSLRNTTRFNKVTTHTEMHRSHQMDDHQGKHMTFNESHTQEYGTSFLKPGEKRQPESHTSFVSPSKTPPKKPATGDEKDFGRAPTKYKTYGGDTAKTSAMSRSPEGEEKPLLKSLNEIMEIKQREKRAAENARCGKQSKRVNGFQFGRPLGKGKFGEVFLARHHDTGFIAAIKKIKKKNVIEFKMVDQFTKQIRLHACLDHPNIVKFFGVFEEKQYVFLVMEYMNGGTLFDYLNEVPSLTPKVTAEYLKDIIEAVNHMHDKSIAHRDIKPQNIVISSEGVAKLCDFGWSALVDTSRMTYCGTFDYAPPEILERKNYDASVDLWCLGVLTFELLTGRVPFEGSKRNQVMEKIVNVDKYKIEYPVGVPEEAKQLIEALVQKDPALRPRGYDLLKFKFFSVFLPKGGKTKKMQ